MGVCTEPDKVALVMEYVDGKSLDRMLHEEKVPLTLHQKFQLAKDIAKGTPSSSRLSPRPHQRLGRLTLEECARMGGL
jgi:serine/threonine protein kinase